MTFNELIHQDKPVLVDFHATWCGPCRVMAPVLAHLKKKLNDRVTILKIDVDRNPQAAKAYQVQGVSTLILFRKGNIRWRHSGIVPQQQLEQLILQNS